MRTLVLVLGAGGQLGEVIADHFARGHEVIGRTRAELDITDAEEVRHTIATVCPDVVVNCAAYTDVDGAQAHPLTALNINAMAVRTIARATARLDATLVHFSTDFVFDGTSSTPYREEDQPGGTGAYALSKLLGEWFAAEIPRHYVLRVESLFGGPRAKSSVDKLLNGIIAGREVRAFSDRVVSPSYVEDVAMATDALLQNKAPYGLYHCVNTGWTTWSTLARELAVIVDVPDAQIVDVPMAASALIAPRPKFAAMSNAKLEAAAGIKMPTWQEALRRYLNVRR
jgi:dTDP-4-dehydrorhamnose reductase